MKRELEFYHRILILATVTLFSIFLVYLLSYEEFTITGNVNTEIADSSIANIGRFSSIGLDSQGYSHISYYDDVNQDLRYCNNTLGSWTCATLDSVGTRGFETSLAVDSSDKIHIFYNAAGNPEFAKYCTNSGGSWVCSTADNSNDGSGQYPYVATDSNGKAHAVNKNGINLVSIGVNYCNNTEGSWSCSEIPQSADFDSVSVYSSIALDSNDKAHVALFKVGQMMYCNNTNGAWGCSDINPAVSGGYTSIVLDSNDNPHIVTYGPQYCNNTGGSWSCEYIDPSFSIGQFPKMAIDQDNHLHVEYYEPTNDDLRYCNNINGSWVCRKLADADPTFLGSSNSGTIALKKGRLSDPSAGYSGKIHISWYNNSKLMYTTYDPFYPDIIFGSSTTSAGNYSSKNYLEANVTASDTNQISNITVYLYNSTELVQRNVTSTSPIFVNFTNLPEGFYYLNSTVNDTEDNINQTETRSFILDSTGPTISFSCDKEVVTKGEIITCTCSAADALTGVNSTTYTTNPSTATVGSFATSCLSEDNVGNSVSAGFSYEVQALVSGGGGSPGSGEPTETKTNLIVNIKPGEETKISSFGDTGVKEITVKVNSPIPQIKIQVLNYDSKPTEVSKEIEGKRYKYLQIYTENLNENLDNAVVRFEVNKSWASDNGLDMGEVSVFKFDENAEKWNELETTYESEENGEYIYSVGLNSFSYFAIGEKVRVPVVSDIADSVAESYNEASQTKIGLALWWVIFSVLSFGIFMVAILIVQSVKRDTREIPETKSNQNSSNVFDNEFNK